MLESIDTITLRQPDDWHVHLRDGEMLATVLPFTARQFARAIVMPNLAAAGRRPSPRRAPIASASWPPCRRVPGSSR